MTTDTDTLREALERIREIPTKEWSIDTAKALARKALATLSKPEPAAVGVDPDDMSWFTIAVDKRGNTVILDYAPAWEPHGIEFHWEDTFAIDPPRHLPVGAYRWSGFSIGSWDEDDSINVIGGEFTPLSHTPAKAGEDGVREAEDACFIAADPVASPDDVDEDDNPLWTAEVQTVGGWSVVATVWGASPEQASARAIAVASALSSIEEPRG